MFIHFGGSISWRSNVNSRDRELEISKIGMDMEYRYVAAHKMIQSTQIIPIW